MSFVLGKNIQVGQKIKTQKGWRKVREVTEKGARVTEGIIEFGSVVYGWKIK